MGRLTLVLHSPSGPWTIGRVPGLAAKVNRASTSEPVSQAALQQLFAQFNGRRYAEMEQLAQRLAVQHPNSGAIWKALGVALLSQRKDALGVLRRAAELMPHDAEALSSLGGACVAAGQHDEAAACYRRALLLQPQLGYLHSNLADVLVTLGQFEAAEAGCRRALELAPGLVAAQVNLGRALLALGQADEAAASLETAVRQEPRQVIAHRLLSRIHHDRGRLDLALNSIEQALGLEPNHADSLVRHAQLLLAKEQPQLALQSLGRARQLQPRVAERHAEVAQVLQRLGQLEAAALAWEAAVACEPGQAELHSNLGTVLLSLGRAEAAAEAFARALALQPDLAQLHSNMGHALQRQGRYVDALQCHREAVRLGPDQPELHGNLCHALKSCGRVKEALDVLSRALLLHEGRNDLRSQEIFLRQYFQPEQDAALRSALSAFERRLMAGAVAAPDWTCAPVADKRLRVGLLSNDLRAHPVGYFLGSVFAALQNLPGRPVELVAYANPPLLDEVSRHLNLHCTLWRDATVLSDDVLHDQIRADQIDVLIDLAGHTLHNRLPVLALRPAPVQLGWLGYCASSGLRNLDAFLADPWIAPEGAQAAFSEPLVHLPETFLCFTPPSHDLVVSPLPALSAPGLRFACFNDLAKMNPGVVEVWAQILTRVPTSQLRMQSAAYADEKIQAATRDRFALHGIGPERLELRPSQPRGDYLASYREIDICLDPFPYPGGTTTMESLWMGVPVLTLPGQSALSRQGLSIMSNLGLADGWVAQDTRDYVDRAARWAQDLAALASLRASLRPRLLASPLCQADRFARHLESALRGLWHQHCVRGT